MRVALYDGLRERVLRFEPNDHKWGEQNNSRFLRAHQTGLPPPFDKVFVKWSLTGQAPAHDLLRSVVGKTLPGTAKVFGYEERGRECFYFFENLPYDVLRHHVSGANISGIIRPKLVLRIVNLAARLFTFFYREGYIYVDFCIKNIMYDFASHQAFIIDIDSAWKTGDFRERKTPSAPLAVELWGLWNGEISKALPLRIWNAQKTVVLSFAAVWARAVALLHHTKPDRDAAVALVLSPGYAKQRELWEALKNNNRQGFSEYFCLSENKGAAVYGQWQRIFRDFQGGREVAWQEIVSATERVLLAISGIYKPERRLKAHVPLVAKPLRGRTDYVIDKVEVKKAARSAVGVMPWQRQPRQQQDQGQPNQQGGKQGVKGFLAGVKQGFLSSLFALPDFRSAGK